MSNSVFPSLKQSFGQKRYRQFNTIIHKAASGREVRVANQQYPLYKWDLVFDAIFDRNNNTAVGTTLPPDMVTILGFIEQRQGSYDTFLYDDKYDDSVTAQTIGTGNGSADTFDIVRTSGGFTRPVGWIHSVANVTVGGAPVSPSGYSLLNDPAQIQFTSPPASSASIVADLVYYYRVRFDSDAQDFEQQVMQLWKAPKLTIVEVKLN